MKFNFKQIRTQNGEHARAELPNVKASSNNQVAFAPIKCVSPMTFSQNLYQSHTLKIAEEVEQALGANSLENIKRLLNKVLKS